MESPSFQESYFAKFQDKAAYHNNKIVGKILDAIFISPKANTKLCRI